MAQQYIGFDGTKAIPLQALRPDAWTPTDPYDTGAESISVRRGQTSVPTLYRAIDIRAKAVAGMPFRIERRGQDVTDTDELKPLIKRLRNLLYLTESSLCCYNAAYWEVGQNGAGRNATPFWLATTSVLPDIDATARTAEAALRGFYRTGGAGGYLKPRQVTHFWGPSIAVEVGADASVAPVAVTLSAAGLLHYLDVFATSFFQRGGVKMTLLSIQGDAKPAEVEKLDRWWKRMVQGARSAFGSVVVRAGVDPKVIGSDIKDTSSPQLTKLAREDVAIGMGVPMSLLFSNALAGGTAASERLNFYDFTVVPECEHVIDEPLNGFLALLGLRLIWTPEKLEVYQTSELSKAQSISALVGQPIMLVDEGRERMELPPMAEAQAKYAAAAPPSAPTPPTDGGGAPPAAEAAPLGQAAPDAAAPAASSVLLPGPLKSDLLLWQKKALNRLRDGRAPACEFKSAAIDADEAAAIRGALEHATTADAVKAAFEPGQGLTAAERALYERLAAIFDAVGSAVVEIIQRGQMPSVATLGPSLAAALRSAIAEAVNDTLDALAQEVGVAFDAASAGPDIASAYLSRYLTKMDETTRAGLEKAVQAYRATPAMTRDDLVAQLRGVFGARRAELVAITALTEASNQATLSYQEQLAGAGVAMERVWRTANDERVCVICGPLNGKSESVWVERYPRGGPAHFRCRCGTTLRMKKE